MKALPVAMAALALVLVACSASPAAAPSVTSASKSIATAIPPTTAPTAIVKREATSTPIPWESTVAALRPTPIPQMPTPAVYKGGRAKDLLSMPLGSATILSGQVFQMGEQGGNTYLALETADFSMGSDPLIVIGLGKLSAPAESQFQVDVYATYIGKVTAADRWGVNMEMPIVRAHKVIQTKYPIYPMGLFDKKRP